MTAVTYACGLDPSCEPRVLPVDVQAAQQEVNVGHFVCVAARLPERSCDDPFGDGSGLLFQLRVHLPDT